MAYAPDAQSSNAQKKLSFLTQINRDANVASGGEKGHQLTPTNRDAEFPKWFEASHLPCSETAFLGNEEKATGAE